MKNTHFLITNVVTAMLLINKIKTKLLRTLCCEKSKWAATYLQNWKLSAWYQNIEAHNFFQRFILFYSRLEFSNMWHYHRTFFFSDWIKWLWVEYIVIRATKIFTIRHCNGWHHTYFNINILTSPHHNWINENTYNNCLYYLLQAVASVSIDIHSRLVVKVLIFHPLVTYLPFLY